MSTTRPSIEYTSTGEEISKRKMENFQLSSNVINTDNSTNRGNEMR